jgi:PAS domain S-box-containing protein
LNTISSRPVAEGDEDVVLVELELGADRGEVLGVALAGCPVEPAHQRVVRRVGDASLECRMPNLGSVPDELVGREVSCRALGVILDAARRSDLADEELVEGSGYPIEHIADPGQRISWEAFCTILRNGARRWNDDELRAIGASVFDHGFALPVRIVGRLLYSVPEFYLWVFGPRGPAEGYFASAETSIRELGPGHLLCESWMRPGYSLSRENYVMLLGALQGASRTLGYDTAQVEHVQHERGAQFHIRVPVRGGWLGPLRRGLGWLFAARAAARELQEAHEALHTRYLELQREVNARNEAEQARRDLLDRLQHILDALPVGCIVHDAQGRATYSNAVTRRQFGERLQQGSVLELMGLDPEERTHKLARVLAGEALGPVVRDGVDSRGQPRRIEWWHTPLRGAQGEVLGLVSTFADATERERLEASLSQAQRLEVVGRLAGGIAHDFNNLLTVILAGGGLLASSLEDGDPRRDDLEQIQSAALRGAELTQQLLALGRRQVHRPTTLEVDRVISGLVPMLRRLVREDIELQVHCASAPGRVYADPAQLERVLINLVVNASDAMPGPGKLRIETSAVWLDEAQAATRPELEPGRYVLLTVSDTGVGMDSETRARAFDPFFTTKPVGTGLGLSIVYGLVRQGGGHVSVHSELGKGSTFQVYLPDHAAAAEQERPPLPEPSTPPPARGTETVLVVEDEPEIRALVCQVLEEQGYRVLEAGHPDEALSVSRQQELVHLLLTDMVLPGRTGLVLAEELLAQRPKLRVLFMSGYAPPEVLERSLGTGATFLAKPFSATVLIQQVRAMLDA